MRSASSLAFVLLLMGSVLSVSLSWIAHLPRAGLELRVGLGTLQLETLSPMRRGSYGTPPTVALLGAGAILRWDLPVEVTPFAYLSEAGRWISSFDLRAPTYPESARRDGREGIAVVVVEFGESGKARGVFLGKSSGHRDLDEAALDSARSLRVILKEKALKDSRALKLLIPFEFRLKR